MFDNLPKKFLIYAICCNVTNKKYIGSTSNLTSRLAVHLSSYKNKTSTCSSVEIFKNDNYNCIILQDNLEKNQIKERELFFIKVFEHNIVNKYRPMLEDMKEYQKEYQKTYRLKQR
jgi:hypothetical protein